MSLFGSLAGLDPGDRVVYGVVALDGSNPTDVVIARRDPAEKIKFAQVCLNSSTAPGDSTEAVTATWAAMTLSIYGWMNTGGTDPTLVASTGTQNVAYFAIIGR